jgi:hypothetical protein
MWKALAITLAVLAGAALVIHTVFAQNPPMPHMPMHQGSTPQDTVPPTATPSGPMQHGHHMAEMRAAGAPAQPGQDAFGAIAEVVRTLDADPKTDWSTVDLERLRQHLIDMNEVVLHSEVKQTAVPGGLAMEVTGTGRTEQAIRSMVVPHATELDHLPAYAARSKIIPGGVRLTVTAKSAGDVKTVARLRGLGFIGLLTEGGHHGPHHLAMAKGQAFGGHPH